MSQTAYNINMAVGVEGGLYDSAQTQDILSRLVSTAGAATIPAGRLVIWKTPDADNLVRLPTATGEVTGNSVMGVSMYDASKEPGPYGLGDTIPVVRSGRIWVITEEAVTPTSTVFVRFASGAGGSNLGGFRASADTATAVALPGARFMTSAGAGGLVVVEINLPA